MNLPAQLAEDFQRLEAAGPRAVARSLQNLDGSLGNTWLAVGAEELVFYFRPLGGAYSRKSFKLSSARRMESRLEGGMAIWRGRFPEAVYELTFPVWDIRVLNQITHLWKPEATDVLGPAPTALDAASAFCASIHALVESGTTADEVELEWMGQRIPDTESVRLGGAWLSLHGEDKLAASLTRLLTPQQRECLLANLISCAMVRGSLAEPERKLIDRFKNALRLDAERFDQILTVLTIKDGIGVITAGEGDAMLDLSTSSPAILFAAALLALSACDDETHPAEEAYLARLIPQAVVVSEGRSALSFVELDGLLDSLSKRLDEAQRHCLMTNLIGMAMVDGKLHAAEQELIGRFREAMDISESDFLAYLDVILAKNNLSVFG